MGQGSQPGGVQRRNQDAGRNSHRFTNVIVFQFGLVLVFAEFFSEDDDQVGRGLEKGLVGVSTKRRQSV